MLRINMIAMLEEQLKLTPNDSYLQSLRASVQKEPGRIVSFSFDGDLTRCYIRGEIRNREGDYLTHANFIDESKIPYIHDELIRLGFAKFFFDEQKRIVAIQLEKLRERLFKDYADEARSREAGSHHDNDQC